MDNQRIRWIDGLRGYACLAIVIHHFLVAFLPSAYSLNNVPSICNGWDTKFAGSVLNVFVNGNFFVCVFCAVSAFVLFRAVYSQEEARGIGKIFLKRYPRLAFPMVALCLIVWILRKLNLFFMTGINQITGVDFVEGSYQAPLSIRNVISSSLYAIWFAGDTRFSTAFWMLGILFKGSFLAMILAVMVKGVKKRAGYVILLFVLLLFSRNLSYETNFVAGAFLAYAYSDLEKFAAKKYAKVLGMLSILAGLFLGGYPSDGIRPNYYLRLAIEIQKHTMKTSLFCHVWGAVFLLCGIILFSPIQRVLMSKALQFLGKISYSVYLVHIPILYSLGAFLIRRIASSQMNYVTGALLIMILSLGAVIIVAELFFHFVERNCTKLTNVILDKCVMDRK